MIWYWLVWLVIGFGVPEAWAIISGHPQYTLSDTVWRIFQVEPLDPTPWHWKFVHFILAAFMLWLTGHFVFRIWR